MHRLSVSVPPPRHEQHAGDLLRRRSPPVLGAVGAGGKSRSGPLPRVTGLSRSGSSSSSSSSGSEASSPSSSPPLSHSAVGADRGSDPVHADSSAPTSSSSTSPAENSVKTVTSIGEPTPLRRFLSADGEREAVEVLREQFVHEKRITSDDVRYVVRMIASRGGRLMLPADFPPTRWVLEFKRRYGFAAYSAAVADGASALANAAATAAGSQSALSSPSVLVRRPRDHRVGSDTGSVRSASVIARVTNSSCSSSADSDGEGDGDGDRNADNGNYSMDVVGTLSRRRRRYGYGYGYEFGDSGPTKMRYAVPTGPYYDEADSPTHTAEDKTVMALQQDPTAVNASLSQQQQQQQNLQSQQQQRSSQLVPSLTTIMERRGFSWPSSAPPSIRTSNSDKGPASTSSVGATSMSRSTSGSTGTSSSSNSRAVVGTSAPGFAANSWGTGVSSTAAAARILVGPLAKKPLLSVNSNGSTSNYSLQDDEQSMSSTSSSAEKRKYKLSHTVSPEIWEKAIAAVEQQGMSLRAAAKIYGVHFAALHRRVKKRAANGHAARGNQGYFHPSDEAGIMRVVVARAELGVLMTFDELMELVETAALRKLPNISVEAARSLMTRFQSRNEQSIRHIIVDWPLPRVAPHVAARLPPSPGMRALHSAPPAATAIPVPAETTVPL